MQANADTQPGNEPVARHQIHTEGKSYTKVFGPGKRRIRGLWRRGERFYAQPAVEDPATGKKPVRRVSLDSPRTWPGISSHPSPS